MISRVQFSVQGSAPRLHAIFVVGAVGGPRSLNAALAAEK